MEKTLLLLVLFGTAMWTWFVWSRGDKVEGAELVALASAAELKNAQNFVCQAIGEYRRNGEKALQGYWIYPIYEPEFKHSTEVLNSLAENSKVQPGRAVHPKFNQDSLLMDVQCGERNFQVALTREKQEYYLQSVRLMEN